MNSLFSNISCSFLQEKSTYFENCQKLCFRIFLEIMKNGLKYLFALTPSIELTVLYALNFYVFYFLFFFIFTLADVFKNQPFPIIFPLDQAQTSIFSL